MIDIPLDALHPHPLNANRMPRDRQQKLKQHIAATGHYPPLIVRPHVERESQYQLLDGHHRVEVLRDLGYIHARCDVWEDVDDQQARVLLLTLNRLQGEDDPQRRGELLRELATEIDIDDLTAMLPDGQSQIQRLLTLADPPPARPAAPMRLDDMPQAVTFFMTGKQRTLLMNRLRSVDRDRTAALFTLLGLLQQPATRQ